MSDLKILNLLSFMKEVHDLHVAKGFYNPPRSKIESLALVHSEVSEVVEEVRKSAGMIYYNPGNPKPEGEAVELADAVLRILDYCQYHEVPLVEAMLLKHEYNKTRPYKHGKLL